MKNKKVVAVKKTAKKSGKSGFDLRIETLTKLVDEAKKVVVADKGKSTPKILVEKVKTKMKPPSKARVAVTLALASKETGNSHVQSVAAFQVVKVVKSAIKKIEKKLSHHLNNDEVSGEIESMLVAAYKFVESSYSLGRKKKSDNFNDPADDEDSDEEPTTVTKVAAKVKTKKSTKFVDPGDQE